MILKHTKCTESTKKEQEEQNFLKVRLIKNFGPGTYPELTLILYLYKFRYLFSLTLTLGIDEILIKYSNCRTDISIR